MNCIVLDYQQFTVNSTIYIRQDDKCYSFTVNAMDMGLVADTLISTAHQYGIYDVKVIASYIFREKLINVIKNYELQTYSENKLKVEGISHEAR